MKLNEAVEILKQHNIWRRSEVESAIMGSPTQLGIAIDTIINHYEGNVLDNTNKTQSETVNDSMEVKKTNCKCDKTKSKPKKCFNEVLTNCKV